MDVTSTSSTTSATSTAKKTTKDETSGTALTGDFDTFLKLLTAQMKNQDPLQPMDSTEFVAQLASFSSVEQQIGSNTRLDKIVSALSGSTASFANWIGKEVQAPTSASFAGKAINVAVTPADGADRAELVVKNDFGKEIARQTVTAGATSVSWDGKDSSGNTVANGNYSFTLESFAGATLAGSSAGRVYGTVTEVRLDDAGEAVLVLDNGGQIAPDKITAVR